MQYNNSRMGNPYKDLGVPYGANEALVKKAYRNLVKKYHPDSGGVVNDKEFERITSAYEVLKKNGFKPPTLVMSQVGLHHEGLFKFSIR